ncbi:hypothetical protein K461DRAFT_37633 [Myriangium duriaei CBS 260.36]|uniref:Uncharacterized protein n=1 Tax=Myriangium duriaei CBS 260.36 TaxID=1168546 RepID=A0A9P4IUN3_9PEZI|nr:hypothetical protein K461DRAFT_37633 [Myriangium duriaei CBS 260.36]
MQCPEHHIIDSNARPQLHKGRDYTSNCRTTVLYSRNCARPRDYEPIKLLYKPEQERARQKRLKKSRPHHQPIEQGLRPPTRQPCPTLKNID